MLTEGKLAITTRLMEQGAIMMVQLRHHHHIQQTKHMGVEVRHMEEEAATQVVLQDMKLEIMQRVDTANLFLMLERDMARLPVPPEVDTLNRKPTSPTLNQVKFFILTCGAVYHSLSHDFVV
jgi:hypothetical protein